MIKIKTKNQKDACTIYIAEKIKQYDVLNNAYFEYIGSQHLKKNLTILYYKENNIYIFSYIEDKYSASSIAKLEFNYVLKNLQIYTVQKIYEDFYNQSFDIHKTFMENIQSFNPNLYENKEATIKRNKKISRKLNFKIDMLLNKKQDK